MIWYKFWSVSPRPNQASQSANHSCSSALDPRSGSCQKSDGLHVLPAWPRLLGRRHSREGQEEERGWEEEEEETRQHRQRRWRCKDLIYKCDSHLNASSLAGGFAETSTRLIFLQFLFICFTWQPKTQPVNLTDTPQPCSQLPVLFLCDRMYNMRIYQLT